MAKNVVVVGAQWGDEGKGKIVDWLTSKVDGVVRFNGGNNAGHTIVVNGNKTVLRLIPSGVMHPTMQCYLGNGVVFSPSAFFSELDQLKEHGMDAESRLHVSGNCALLMPYHVALDHARENNLGKKKIGTTGRGIGPAYEDKVARRTVRVADLYNVPFFEERVRTALEYHNFELTHFLHAEALDPQKVIDEVLGFADRLKPRVMDVSHTLNKLMAEGKQFLFEGAQGSMLDIDHGTYPFVTSSNPTAGGACTGTGVGPTKITRVIGVSKAYVTRVGEGPFPTELFGEEGEWLRAQGHEYGVTTGRPRRCGWFDAVVNRYAAQVNGLTDIVLTKLDVLTGLKEIPLCVAYDVNGERRDDMPTDQSEFAAAKPIYESMPGWDEDISQIHDFNDLPKTCQDYVKRLEELSGCRISVIGTGPQRDHIIQINSLVD